MKKTLSCLLCMLVTACAMGLAGFSAPLNYAPRTGDENNIVIWIVILAVALVAIGVLVWSLLRRNRKPKDPDK